MDQNESFERENSAQENYPAAPSGSKPIHTPSLVLMIIGAVFCLLLPIVTYPCSVISLVMSINNRQTHKTTYAIVINIIALVLALINSILGVIMSLGLSSMVNG